MKVENMDELVGFALDFIQEEDLLDDNVVAELARKGQSCKKAEEINIWLKVVRERVKGPNYDRMKRKFEDRMKNSSKKRKIVKVDTIQNAQARFALDFVQEKQLLTEEVVALLVTHAESNKSTKDHDKWMTFVKVKIGFTRYKEMQRDYTEFCKKDCGFEPTTAGDIAVLLKKFKSLSS